MTRVWMAPLLLTLTLTACAPRGTAAPPAPSKTAVATAEKPEVTPPADGGAQPAEFGCPPPPPPVYHSMPPPHYVDLELKPDATVLEPGQPVHLTASLHNVAQFPITLGPETPALELQGDGAVAWRFPLGGWAGATLQPGLALTTEAVWPGGEPGYYNFVFSMIHYKVACVAGQPTTGGGGVRVQVRAPADQVISKTLTPKQAVTATGITVRFDRLELSPEATKATLWISGLHAPADLSVGLRRDDSTTPVPGAGLGNRDAEGGGVQVFADFAPTPKGTQSLTITVSDIGVTTPGVGMQRVPGPWQITVQLG